MEPSTAEEETCSQVSVPTDPVEGPAKPPKRRTRRMLLPVHRKPRDNIRRIAFFDLDNTLIPTSWIMQRWRAEESFHSHGKIVQSINQTLLDAGMFEALDDLFDAVKKRVDSIIIITNAGSRTVDNFYLTHCLPQLRGLLRKYNIQLTSTEQWVLALGPPPSSEDEDGFREFYTVVKYREFQSCVGQFLERVDSANSTTQDIKLDVLSVGDQICEISAACRLSESYGDRIRLLKLILILDPTNSRFSYQQPDQFIDQLASLKAQTLRTLAFNRESLMDAESWKKVSSIYSAKFDFREGVAYWVPQPQSMTYAIGGPGRFPTEFPFYLPVKYMGLRKEGGGNDDDLFVQQPADLADALRAVDPNSVLDQQVSSAEEDTKQAASNESFTSQTETTTGGGEEDFVVAFN